MNMGILREFFHEFQATAKRFPTTNGSLGPQEEPFAAGISWEWVLLFAAQS
jgi:hypothetical protein